MAIFVKFLVMLSFLPNFSANQILADLPYKITQNEPEKIFYISQSKEDEGIESLNKNADKIDILAPQFFSVSEKLKLTGGLSSELKSIIIQKGIKTMPLVTNNKFDQKIIHNLLVSGEAQEEIINRLVDLAKQENYIGWQFDFENISYLDRNLYNSFVKKTADSFHKNGLILSVAAVARSVDYEDTDIFKNWSGVFDYVRLAESADFISLMIYDDPDSIGPVASLPFVDRVLNYVRGKIPPEKLSFGIPLYNWGWRSAPFKRITVNGTYDGLLYIKENFKHRLGFDEMLGSAWLTYLWQGEQYEIWYQDKKSFEDKLNIIRQNNFRGFSAWVLGVEDPEIWSAID